MIVYGTTQGVRADAQIGRRLDDSTIDETPILGRKVTTLPLLNASFRQAKGTGDLFVNATYFVTGAGGRRQTTVTLDGANNDEGWGRQTMLATVPIGAIQEMSVLSNAFSAEFGWTAGPALNIVTKSGTNALHGEVLCMGRPGDAQAKTFSTKGFCAPSVASCTTPSTLTAINPADVPDVLEQFSGSIGRAAREGQDLLLRHRRLHAAGSHDVPLADAAVVRASGRRQPRLRGQLPAGARSTARLDHKHLAEPDVDVPRQRRSLLRHQPERRRRRHQRAERGPQVLAPLGDRRRSTSPRSLDSNIVNEARFAYLNGDPVTLWEAQTLSTTYTRAGSVPFTIGQSRLSDLFGRQAQLSDTLSWSHGRHSVRVGGSLARHSSGGTGNEPGFAVLGTFTFLAATTAPPDQLTLAQVQQYTQPMSYGVTSYELNQWLGAVFAQDSIRVGRDLTVDAGHPLRPPDADRRDHDFAPRVGLGVASGRRRANGGARRLRPLLHADSIEPGGRVAPERPRRLHQLRRDARAAWLPDLPDRAVRCRWRSIPGAAGVAVAGARHHDQGGPAGVLHRAVRAVRAELQPAAELRRRVRQPAQPGDLDRRRARDHEGAVRRERTTCTSTGPISIARWI